MFKDYLVMQEAKEKEEAEKEYKKQKDNQKKRYLPEYKNYFR